MKHVVGAVKLSKKKKFRHARLFVGMSWDATSLFLDYITPQGPFCHSQHLYLGAGHSLVVTKLCLIQTEFMQSDSRIGGNFAR